MTMMRWNPWNGHSALRSSLERFSEPRAAPDWWRASGNLGIDVEDQSDHYRLTASLPGFESDDVDVSITGRAVTVSAEQKTETEQDGKENPYLLRERYSGALIRRLILPAAVEGAGAKAEFKNGVLTIDLPKTAGAETQKVDITTPS